MLTKRERAEKWLKRLRLRLSGTKGDAACAFVFGEMRSGTNMLIGALGRCPDTECYGETDEEAFEDYVLRDNDIVSSLVRNSRARVVVFKAIADSQCARQQLAEREGSKAVWIYRGYGDSVSSALRNFQEHNRYLHYMLHEPETASWRVQNVSAETLAMVKRFHEAGISEASARALIWLIRNKLFFEQDLHEDPNVLLVNYERIVTNPTVEMRKITDFLGCEYSDRAVRGVFSSSVNKKVSLDIRDDIRSLCDEMFERLERVHRAARPGEESASPTGPR